MTPGSNSAAEDFRILTCSDAGFFQFLPSFERNVFRRFDKYPVIYDLGLSSGQAERLKSQVDQVPFDGTYGAKTPLGFVRTTHKPDCIRHFLETQEESCLYADADIFFVGSIDESVFYDCDVAVTPRHPRELRAPRPFENGKINAGVMYFRNTPAVRAFVVRWQAACADPSISDQLAMSHLLENADLTGELGLVECEGLRILKLDPVKFNDTGCAHGEIWHFKNAGRRTHKRWRRNLVGWLDGVSPAALRAYANARKRRQSL